MSERWKNDRDARLVRWADLPPWRGLPVIAARHPEEIWTSDEIMASAARVPWTYGRTQAAAYQRRIWWLQRKHDQGW